MIFLIVKSCLLFKGKLRFLSVILIFFLWLLIGVNLGCFKSMMRRRMIAARFVWVNNVRMFLWVFVVMVREVLFLLIFYSVFFLDDFGNGVIVLFVVFRRNGRFVVISMTILLELFEMWMICVWEIIVKFLLWFKMMWLVILIFFRMFFVIEFEGLNM